MLLASLSLEQEFGIFGLILSQMGLNWKHSFWVSYISHINIWIGPSAYKFDESNFKPNKTEDLVYIYFQYQFIISCGCLVAHIAFGKIPYDTDSIKYGKISLNHLIIR